MPAAGAPLQDPSDSPGGLIQRYASTRESSVTVVLGLPSARPTGLHHWLSAVGPSPFRPVSMTKCLPPIRSETALPNAMLLDVSWKLDTFKANPSAPATFARISLFAWSLADFHAE